MSSFKDHFSKLAAQYSQFRPKYPPALFEYLAGICEQRQLCWDCACGSGQATVSLAQHFDAVIGTDASEKQVAAAEQHPSVQYRVAPAEASGLQPGSVDLVTVAQSLHWFRIEEFYAEAHRVLKPGGVLAVWTYGVQHVAEEPRVDAEVQRFYSEVVGPYWPPERRLVESGYRDLAFPFDEIRPWSFVMQEHWSMERLLGYFRSWSATGRYVEVHNEDPVVALGERLAPLWGDIARPRLIDWPLALRVGRKT
jgi:ubiquinone/menaquinone biosynthesis C-methylase UbiE